MTMKQDVIHDGIIYSKNGVCISSDEFDSSCNFSIQLYQDDYFYPNDGLLYDVEAEIINLHSLIERHFFDDEETCSIYKSSLRMIIDLAGFSSEVSVSKNEFIKYVEKIRPEFPEIYRYMCMRDLEFVLDSMHTLILEISHLFVSYYVNLSKVNVIKDITEDVIVAVSNRKADRVFFDLSNYFVKLHSIMDLITKLAYELQSTEYDFTKYKPLKCNKVQYGDKKYLEIYDISGTLGEKNDFTREIESIRNEIIHNGSWQQPQNVYVKLQNGSVVERFVLYPDMETGHYAKCINRYHFFGQEKKVNDLLPQINVEFFKRLMRTLYVIINSKRHRGVKI